MVWWWLGVAHAACVYDWDPADPLVQSVALEASMLDAPRSVYVPDLGPEGTTVEYWQGSGLGAVWTGVYPGDRVVLQLELVDRATLVGGLDRLTFTVGDGSDGYVGSPGSSVSSSNLLRTEITRRGFHSPASGDFDTVVFEVGAFGAATLPGESLRCWEIELTVPDEAFDVPVAGPLMLTADTVRLTAEAAGDRRAVPIVTWHRGPGIYLLDPVREGGLIRMNATDGLLDDPVAFVAGPPGEWCPGALGGDCLRMRRPAATVRTLYTEYGTASGAIVLPPGTPPGDPVAVQAVVSTVDGLVPTNPIVTEVQ